MHVFWFLKYPLNCLKKPCLERYLVQQPQANIFQLVRKNADAKNLWDTFYRIERGTNVDHIEKTKIRLYGINFFLHLPRHHLPWAIVFFRVEQAIINLLL